MYSFRIPVQLSVGTRLGPYEIVSPLGAGGMGEVYRAKDTRLDRHVAVKILAAQLAQNAQFRLRFEREAKTISQLNHPNICTLYDVGENYLVMELLEGESLADRLAKGLLPLKDVLKYGVQISDALGKAHREGVIHRDLKPGNIMLTKSGLKLLDFGLAKSVMVTSAPEGATAQKPLTQEGMVLGTLQYMAPEQLAGEEPDARTDIFALGSVLYEMATGKHAFEGKTRTSLIGAIVSGEPKAIGELRPLTPPSFEHVVKKCLEKDPEVRWQSATDIAEELRWINEAGSQAGVATPITMRRKTREMIAWGLAFIAAGALVWRLAKTWTEPHSVIRVNVALPPQTFVAGIGARGDVDFGFGTNISFSPDGKNVVYAGNSGGVDGLFMRPLDRFDAAAIPDTEGAQSPFFSPDGEWIGFFANGALKKVAVSGGAPVTLCGGCVDSPLGAVWGEDQTIYFAPRPAGGIYKLSASGGTVVAVSKPDAARNELSHRWPQLLPDGKHLLVTIKTGGIETLDEAQIAIVSLADGKARVVFSGGTSASYIPTGHLVFMRAGSLYAIPFDVKKLQTRGGPIRILGNVFYNSAAGEAGFAFSVSGSLVYLPGQMDTAATILYLDPTGHETLISHQQYYLMSPRLSPDGRAIAFIRGAANDEIALLDLLRGSLTRLSFEPGNANSPVWTPDGRYVIYGTDAPRPGMTNIVWRAADGSGASEELFRSPNRLTPSSVSPDGKLLAYVERAPSTRGDIWLLSLAERKRTPLVQTPFDEDEPIFSPDGRWIAYVSDESGKYQVYVRSAAAGGGRWQISIDGGSLPRWSRNGRALFYWNRHDHAIYRVSVIESGPFSAGRPEGLFSRPDFGPYDVTSDDRFLIVKGLAPSETRQLNVILNWFDDVRKRTGSR
ncbi:MAG: protein kinase [Acidobacteriota bacterium]|nr:protein kinase [Acidobacteriota bacterium]